MLTRLKETEQRETFMLVYLIHIHKDAATEQRRTKQGRRTKVSDLRWGNPWSLIHWAAEHQSVSWWTPTKETLVKYWFTTSSHKCTSCWKPLAAKIPGVPLTFKASGCQALCPRLPLYINKTKLPWHSHTAGQSGQLLSLMCGQYLWTEYTWA